jgi:hypothetical protein
MAFRIKDLDYDFVKIDAIGDGSCMFHSIMQCFNRSYIQSSTGKKMTIIKKLREDLANILNEKISPSVTTVYDELSRGELKNMSSENPSLSLTNMEKSLNSSEWGDTRFLELVSNILKINIFVIYKREKYNTLYQLGDSEIYIKENRESIIIYNSSNVHFDSVGLISKDGVRTLFSYGDEVIKKLRAKMYKGK